jgi:ankyrin repeat protein
MAAQYGNPEMIRLLLNYGAQPNKRDDNLWSPLHYIVSFGSPEGAKLLLKAGAYPNLKNSEGSTPLHIATANEDLELVLILKKANPDIINKYGLRPDDITNNPDIFKLL